MLTTINYKGDINPPIINNNPFNIVEFYMEKWYNTLIRGVL